jgi:hypothetical protein
LPLRTDICFSRSVEMTGINLSKRKFYFFTKGTRWPISGKYFASEQEIIQHLKGSQDSAEQVVRASAYFCPLYPWQSACSNALHAFAVLQTQNWWWSVDNFGDVITVQKFPTKKEVKGKFKGRERFRPVLAADHSIPVDASVIEVIGEIMQKRTVCRPYTSIKFKPKKSNKRQEFTAPADTLSVETNKDETQVSTATKITEESVTKFHQQTETVLQEGESKTEVQIIHLETHKISQEAIDVQEVTQLPQPEEVIDLRESISDTSSAETNNADIKVSTATKVTEESTTEIVQQTETVPQVESKTEKQAAPEEVKVATKQVERTVDVVVNHNNNQKEPQSPKVEMKPAANEPASPASTASKKKKKKKNRKSGHFV